MIYWLLELYLPCSWTLSILLLLQELFHFPELIFYADSVERKPKRTPPKLTRRTGLNHAVIVFWKMEHWRFWNKILSWQAWTAMAPLKKHPYQTAPARFSCIPAVLCIPKTWFPAGKKSNSSCYNFKLEVCWNYAILWNSTVVTNQKIQTIFYQYFPASSYLLSLVSNAVLSSCHGYSVNHPNLPFFSVFYISIYFTGLVMIVWGLQEYISKTPYLCSCWKSPAWAVLTLISLSRFSK